MKQIETTIYQNLIGVTSKVFPVAITHESIQSPNTYPCIVYKRTGTDRDVILEGNSGLSEATIEVSCMAPVYFDAVALADQVRIALKTATQDAANVVYQIKKLILENENDAYFYDIVVNGKAGVFAREMQYTVTYKE